MLDSIYHMSLKYLKSHFMLQTLWFYYCGRNVGTQIRCYGRYYIALLDLFYQIFYKVLYHFKSQRHNM